MEIYALAVTAATWVIVLAVTAADLFRIRPLPAGLIRVQGYGWLLISTCSLAVIAVDVGGWAQSQQRITHMVVIPLSTVGLAMVVGGQVMRGRRGRAQRHSPEL